MPELMEKYRYLDRVIPTLEPAGKNVVRIRGTAAFAGGLSKNDRLYLKDELQSAAGTWIGKPVTINHNSDEKIGHILWAKFEDDTLEYLADIKKHPYTDLLRNKSTDIKGVSIQANYLANECSVCHKWFPSEEEFYEHMTTEHFQRNFKKVPRGIKGEAISLVLSPEEPGIEGTTIELLETKGGSVKPFSQLLEMVIKNKKRKENYMTKQSKKAVVTPKKRIPWDKTVKEQEEPCGEGKHRNEEGECVPDEPAKEQEEPCPEGEHRNAEGECVLDTVKEQEAEPCPTGQHRDEAGNCVPDKVEEQEGEKDSHGCVVGEEYWDETQGKCVAFTVAEKAKFAPMFEKLRKLKEQDMPMPTPEPEVHVCPAGWHWCDQENGCVEDEVSVAEPTNVVVGETEVDTPPAYPILEPIPDCGLNAHYDKDLKVCVPDIVPKDEQEPPDQPEQVPNKMTTATEIKLPLLLKLGEPFADYTDFADCVSKNQDKDDPEAFCATIKRKVEGETTSEIKESTNIYESLKTAMSAIQKLDGTAYKRDVQIAESINKLNRATAKMVNLTKQIPRQLKALQNQTLTESKLRARYDKATHQKAMQELAKTGKALSELREHDKKRLSGLATEIGKNTAGREHTTKVVSGLATGIGKNNELIMRQTKTLENIAEKNTALMSQLKEDVEKQIKELRERTEKTEKTWSEVDEEYLKFKDDKEKEIVELKEENTAIKKELAELKEQNEKKVKETATLTVRMDNMEGKQKGEFKGVAKSVKLAQEEYAEDPLKGG